MVINRSFWWCFGEIHCKPQGDIQTPYIGSDSAKSLQFYWPESWSILCRASERNMFRHFFGMPESSSLVLSQQIFLSANLFFWGWKIVTKSVMNGISNARFPICQNCRWFLLSLKKSPLFFLSAGQSSQHLPALMRFMEMWQNFQIIWRKDEEKVFSTLDK